MKLAFIAALALSSAPAFAQTTMADDAMKLTCKDMMAMDSAGMAAAVKALNGAMMADSAGAMADTGASGGAMADTSAMASGMMSDEDMMKAAQTACAAYPDATVADAMKM